MFTEASNTRDRVFVVLVTLAVFAGLAWVRMHANVQSSESREAENVPLIEQPLLEPVPDQPAPVLDARPSERIVPVDAIATIYECEQDGHRILSDQPCGAAATVRTIRQPNLMDAQDTSRLYETKSRRVAPTTGATRPLRTEGGTVARCAQIDQEVDAINASLRQGYRRAEGRRQRLRDLSAERWDLECRFLKTPSSSRR